MLGELEEKSYDKKPGCYLEVFPGYLKEERTHQPWSTETTRLFSVSKSTLSASKGPTPDSETSGSLIYLMYTINVKKVMLCLATIFYNNKELPVIFL